MTTAANAIVYIESSQTAGSGELTAQSDNKNYNCSGVELWSKKSSYEPSILPNGVKSGGAITTNTSNDTVSIAEVIVNLNGVETTVSSGTAAITRDSTDDYAIHSIIVNSSGALATVAGDADSTALDPTGTRGDPGAPPLIPVDAIEIGQIHITSKTSAVITAAEIKQIKGTHVEMAASPSHEIKYVRVESGVIGVAGVEFSTALPEIHTGAVPKKVYATWYEPEFGSIVASRDFKPALVSHSSSSETYYNNVIRTAVSKTLGQASIVIGLEDGGITDSILDAQDETLWWKMYQNKLASAYMLTLGIAAFDYTESAEAAINATVTITPEFDTLRVTG